MITYFRRLFPAHAALLASELARQEAVRDAVALRGALDYADDQRVQLRTAKALSEARLNQRIRALEDDLALWKCQALARGREVIDLKMQIEAACTVVDGLTLRNERLQREYEAARPVSLQLVKGGRA
jgi:hypothetical protein